MCVTKSKRKHHRRKNGRGEELPSACMARSLSPWEARAVGLHTVRQASVQHGRACRFFRGATSEALLLLGAAVDAEFQSRWHPQSQ